MVGYSCGVICNLQGGDIMAGQNYTVYTMEIAANLFEALDVDGQYIRVLESDGALELSIDNSSFQSIEKGLQIKSLKPFFRLKFKDTSGASNTVKIAVSNDNIQDDRNVITGTVTVSETGAGTFTDIADPSIVITTATLIIAAAGTTKEVSISNLSGNSNNFRIGSSAVAADRGIPLAPGDTIFLNCSAALYAFNSNDGAGGTEKLAINVLS